MRLTKFSVEHFRSVEKIEINFPENTPVILFGPNNVGKSNILKALECMLGEKHASYFDFQDSDYYFRDSKNYPNISFTACFDENFYSGNNFNPSTNTVCFSTNKITNGKVENTFHYPVGINDEKKIFLSNEDKGKCQFIFIDATRDISRQLSYYSQYSILSKMSRRMHEVMQQAVKDKLTEHFKNIKSTFETVPEYKKFHERLQKAFESNIDGFEHKLEIDLSAYDPNNYFNSLRIIAKEGNDNRSFDEFGTGEQQILLMSFVKAYAETFKGENFILGIEEPEAHLHPIAQKWLGKNISSIAKSGIQVILTTHSPEFLDIENLEGFVKVYKENGITKGKQHTAKTLAESCIQLKADKVKTKEENILQFYMSKTFYDQLRGFFARKILLVEGETEFFALPNYFRNFGYDLIRNGIEIVNCRGKMQITRNYRLFKSYNYDCFCLFDADTGKGSNSDLANTFGFNEQEMKFEEEIFVHDLIKKYGYFGKEYESYLRKKLIGYSEAENLLQDDKVIKAKVLSEQNKEYKPAFIEEIAKALSLKKEIVKESEETSIIVNSDDIPF
jgi:putative ATP-dependent endonuclease of OLD family